MKRPPDTHEVFLPPGGFHFGGGNTRISTILGSCVSIVMWHKQLLIGGMCHYLLPSRSKNPRKYLDGRYAEDALELFMEQIRANKTDPRQYQVKIFGGGSMFPQHKQSGNYVGVPCRNVLAARELVKRYNLKVVSENLGGEGHRRVFFDVWNGEVWLRQIKINELDLRKKIP